MWIKPITVLSENILEPSERRQHKCISSARWQAQQPVFAKAIYVATV